MKQQLECPLCCGTGKIVKRKNAYTHEQRTKARKLYAEGVFLREIGKIIGVEGSNHPQKVKSLIMSLKY